MIWLFWALTALMTILAVAVVLWPFLRRRARDDESRRADNVAIYRERIAELDTETAAGNLETEQAQTLRAEYGRRLVDEAGDGAAEPAAPASRSRRVPWAVGITVAVLLPALAFGWYFVGGDRQLAGGDPATLPYMARHLEQRVRENPHDAQGWLLLGRVRQAQQKFKEAATDYSRANKLVAKPNADMLVLEGEARTKAAGGMAAGKPLKLFEKALKIDPDNGPALWYAGLGAVQSGNRKRARVFWTRLSKQQLPDKFRKLLKRALSSLEQSDPAPPPPAQSG